MAKKNPFSQAFFMRIDSPADFRRGILESSKMTLSILKQIYGVKKIREAKQDLITKISKELKELKILAYKANELMPAHRKEDLRKMFPRLYLEQKTKEKAVEEPVENLVWKPIKKPKEEPAGKTIRKKTSPSAFPDQVSDVGKITRALDEVQRKLANL